MAKLLLYVGLLGLFMCAQAHAQEQSSVKIAYIEASTVNRWKVRDWPSRMKRENIKIDFFAEYQFDKSESLNKVLTSGDLPQYVILQECSVYFPGDLDDYKERFTVWIERIRKVGATPVIATSVPPAESQGYWQDFKNLVKEKLLAKPSQVDQVLAFNDWLRAYSKREGISIFDLEEIFRVDSETRYMDDKYDSGDGIHLNQIAYEILDKEFAKFVTQHILQEN